MFELPLCIMIEKSYLWKVFLSYLSMWGLTWKEFQLDNFKPKTFDPKQKIHMSKIYLSIFVAFTHSHSYEFCFFTKASDLILTSVQLYFLKWIIYFGVRDRHRSFTFELHLKVKIKVLFSRKYRLNPLWDFKYVS